MRMCGWVDFSGDMRVSRNISYRGRDFLAGQGRSRIDCPASKSRRRQPMQQPNRRRFLFLAAGGLGAAALGDVAWREAVRELRTIHRTSFALGTQVSITARHASPPIAERAITAAFAE